MAAVHERGCPHLEDTNARSINLPKFVFLALCTRLRLCLSFCIYKYSYGQNYISQLENFCSEGISGEESAFSLTMSHEEYANIYGPTTGDRIRLGDTDLIAEIENDFSLYGDECVFGGGKVLRDGMGQACGYVPIACLDTVITNAVVIDYSGIFKADIGIKNGLIVSLGKAGNPDIMNVAKGIIIGVSLTNKQ